MSSLRGNNAIQFLYIASILTLTGCGGGGTAGSPTGGGAATSLSGIASKGPIANATVTAYCGPAASGNKLGTATTISDGSYSLSYTGSCATPVELVMTPTNSSTMYNEVTGTNDPVPAGFSMSAYVANPTNTITASITPFTDMAAKVLDTANGRGTTPTSSSVGAAINAVVITALGGDSQLYSLNPMIPSSAISSGNVEEEKLATLLTAISSRVQSIGAASAVAELEQSALNSITIGASGVVSVGNSNPATTPAAILNTDINNAISTLSGASGVNPAAASLTAGYGSTLIAASTVVSSETIRAPSAGVTTAKSLFTSLRSNALLLNPNNSPTLRTEITTIKTDLKGQDRGKKIGEFVIASRVAQNLLAYSAPVNTFQNFGNPFTYIQDYCSVIATGKVVCDWNDVPVFDVSGNYVSDTTHETTFTLTSTGMAWSDELVTYNTLTALPTTPPIYGLPFTGTETSTGLPSSISTQISLIGKLPSQDPTIDHSSIKLNETSTPYVIGGANTTLTLTGNISDMTANNSALFSMNINSGSQIVVTPPANMLAGPTPVSINLSITAQTQLYQYDGVLAISQFVKDAGGWNIPSNTTFTGSMTSLVSGVATKTSGIYLSGIFTETFSMAPGITYNNKLPISSTNYALGTVAFKGIFTNNTVSPSENYAINLTADNTATTVTTPYNSGAYSITYTDPGSNKVTISGLQVKGGTVNITATLGAITLVLTGGGTSITGNVYSGDPTVSTNLIGTVSGNRVNYTDGTFSSLL